ncbi:hypothetical protein [Elizabethkingia occulta]|nr:hypothetical protein [Elizabethkingia occulta]
MKTITALLILSLITFTSCRCEEEHDEPKKNNTELTTHIKK